MSDNILLKTQGDIAQSQGVALMSQIPSSVSSSAVMPRGESPLHHADFKTLASQGNKDGGVTLQEYGLFGHIVLRGNSDDDDFVQGVHSALGVNLPAVLQSDEAGDVSIRWISPDEWLIVVPSSDAHEAELRLRQYLSGHFAVVNASGGQTILHLSGTYARNVLMKSMHYDIHDRNFPVGKVVTTTLAKSQVVMRRTANNSWELIIRRTFSDYIWLWLQDASAEFGLVIK
jgi:sarcosine oxidase subunit gamma